MVNSWKEFLIDRPVAAWDKFWFSANDSELRSLALFRVVFGATMLFFYITRAQDVAFFYGENGLLPSNYAKTIDYFRYHPSIFFGVESTFVLNFFHSIFLLSLFLITIGLFTRVVIPVAYFLDLMFQNRNQTVMFGADMISTFFFFYLMFANSSAYYSLDAKLLQTKKWFYSNRQTVLSHIALRLMQLQLCIIYGYSGLEKLKGTRWWDGSAIWDVFSMGNLQRWDMSFIAHMPVFLSINAYVVLFWEIYFPVLVWRKELRIYMLFIGVLMHIGIGLFMNLPSFAALMISIYALFLTGEEVQRFLPKRFS